MVLLPKVPDLITPAVDSGRKKELLTFEKLSGVRFRKLGILNLAFSHRSYSNEVAGSIDNNEKLEFLGDSVLGLVVSDYLFRIMAERPEGELARIKSFVVSEDSLAGIAKNITVDKYILIGKGEEHSGGRTKKAILADCMEAIFGAYYLDSGYKNAQNFILRYLIPEIDKVLANKHRKDYKTLLQEFVQKQYKSYPKYSLIKKTGPDHNRTFWVEVSVKGKVYGSGKGKNKKEAEQKAAGIAFNAINEDAADKD